MNSYSAKNAVSARNAHSEINANGARNAINVNNANSELNAHRETKATPLLSMSDFVQELPYPYIKGMLQGAELSGFSVATILDIARLPADLLDDPATSIDGEGFYRLLDAISVVTGDMFMGFLTQPGKIAMDEQQHNARAGARTLGEFIRTSTRFREAVRNDVHYGCITDDARQEFTLTVHYDLREGVDPHIFYFHRLMLIYRYYCWGIGKRIKLNRVGFTGPQPDYCMDYPALFHCDVVFNQHRNFLAFDKRYLLNNFIRSPNEHLDFLKGTPSANWMVVPSQDRSWTRQVEDILMRLQKEGMWSTSIEQVSTILSINSRTLRRQLTRENETFQAIKARVSCDAAKNILATTDKPISLIAGEVGFTEPGVFTRAFISWTNMTPSAYRASQQEKVALN